MSLKKFSIFTAIIVSVLVVLTIVLSCIKVDGGLNVTPDKIIVYLENSSGITCYDDSGNQRNKAHYAELLKRYNQMTKLSIMDYMLRGEIIDKNPSQDLDDKYDSWSYANKSNYYCMELIFREKQSVVIKYNGDSKVVDFYGLIMKVEKSTLSHKVALYFSTTSDYDTSKSYTSNPILINANQNSLYKYLTKMTEEQK